jgi:hypothetical protein
VNRLVRIIAIILTIVALSIAGIWSFEGMGALALFATDGELAGWGIQRRGR